MSVTDEPLGMNLHGHPRCCSMTPNAHITVWGNGFQINIMAVNKETHLCILFSFSSCTSCATSFGPDMTTNWWRCLFIKGLFLFWCPTLFALGRGAQLWRTRHEWCEFWHMGRQLPKGHMSSTFWRVLWWHAKAQLSPEYVLSHLRATRPNHVLPKWPHSPLLPLLSH